MSAREVSWTKMFAYAPATSVAPKAKKCTCGNGNCRTARRILCTCKCHSLHHGEENSRGMEPLEKMLGLEKPEPPGLFDPDEDRLERDALWF